MKALTNKQRKALKILEWFIPGHVNWNSPHAKYYDQFIREVIEDSKGLEAEEAFFLRSERGIKTERIKNTVRYRQLMWAQRWMATQIKMWQGGSKDLILTEKDFKDDPPEIWELYKSALYRNL